MPAHHVMGNKNHLVGSGHRVRINQGSGTRVEARIWLWGEDKSRLGSRDEYKSGIGCRKYDSTYYDVCRRNTILFDPMRGPIDTERGQMRLSDGYRTLRSQDISNSRHFMLYRSVQDTSRYQYRSVWTLQAHLNGDTSDLYNAWSGHFELI